MTVTTILESLDAEIGRLRQARALLTEIETPAASPRRGRPKGAAVKPSSPKKRMLSPEARERIAAAQRERWSKRKSQD